MVPRLLGSETDGTVDRTSGSEACLASLLCSGARATYAFAARLASSGGGGIGGKVGQDVVVCESQCGDLARNCTLVGGAYAGNKIPPHVGMKSSRRPDGWFAGLVASSAAARDCR